MTNRPDPFDQMIEQYIDGALAHDDVERFEQHLERNASLAQTVDAARAIDQSISRQFAAIRLPDDGDVVYWIASIDEATPDAHANGVPAPRRMRIDDAVNHAPSSPQQANRRWIGPVVSIAAVLVIAFGVWQIITMLFPSGGSSYTPPPWQSVVSAYEQEVRSGFDPRWICHGEELEALFASQYGQSLQVGPLPPSATALGIDYVHSLSPNTTMVLFRVQDEPVVVFVDRLEFDAREIVQRHGRPDLFVHRRTIGTLVLYEVSHRSSPVLLDSFSAPRRAD